MKTQTFTAPSAWASAIVNIDYSGMTEDDTAALNNFLVRERLSFVDCVGCNAVGFRRTHDAWPEMPLAANCHEYVFPVRASA